MNTEPEQNHVPLRNIMHSSLSSINTFFERICSNIETASCNWNHVIIVIIKRIRASRAFLLYRKSDT